LSELFTILLIAWLAGLAAFTGGFLAHVEPSGSSEFKEELTHAVVAFGGGILLAAVAFTLAPKGMEHLSITMLVVTFTSGGIIFCMLDYIISQQVGSRANLMAMLMDFIPESLALGALFGGSRSEGYLLALFIAAQNLPEGFNSFKESTRGKSSVKATLGILFASSFFGPLAAYIGYSFLADSTSITSGIMSFASGGILYLIFQDIAPQSKMGRHWVPALGAILGFVLGMVGKLLLG
jgi:ZIP family zinc transporter